jgi:hypothetical protein
VEPSRRFRCYDVPVDSAAAGDLSGGTSKIVKKGFEGIEAAPAQKNSRPNNPTTCGKAERFQQTLKKWLAAQPPAQPRPHRSLPHQATPATAYAARPKAAPGDRSRDTHDRVRTDRVDKAGKVTLRHGGRVYSIGIGRTHARTRVLLLVQDLHIHVVNTATGELLREPSDP